VEGLGLRDEIQEGNDADKSVPCLDSRMEFLVFVFSIKNAANDVQP
jgi:hypothetical protein